MPFLRFISQCWAPLLALAFFSQIATIYLRKILPEKFPERFSGPKARAATIPDLRMVYGSTNSRLMKIYIGLLIVAQVLKYACVILAVVSYGLAYLLSRST
jgi:hypothetical protein